MTARPPPKRPDLLVLKLVAGLALAGLALLAWRAAGGLGVGLLGLFVLFVAVRMDLEGNRPIGPEMTPGLHASQFAGESRRSHADRAAERSAWAGFLAPLRLAMVLGGLLVVIGFGGLILFELPA